MGDAGDVLLLALQSLAGTVKHSGVHSVLGIGQDFFPTPQVVFILILILFLKG